MSEKEKDGNFEIENQEWLASLCWILKNESPERVQELLQILRDEAQKHGIASLQFLTTPYLNTIPPEDEIPYPGNLKLEKN